MAGQGRSLHVSGRRFGRGRSHPARTALSVLSRMMHVADEDTSAHSVYVASLVPRVGGLLGMRGEALEELELAAEFHDIGKVAVPGELLRKPGPLDERERRIMACHVEWGAELLRHLPHCTTIAQVVRHHHERYDGSGYPDGLADGGIPLASRIIAACDAYGAMMSDRPYRPALGPDAAVSELSEGAGTQFDPQIVDLILRIVPAGGRGAA